ncbi:hypothetical protein FNH22_00140 [Fulvivirga sp. M361]|uniref:hypothetical protein n=1 Tax=Fulvivirga sp. M361 TaxID=2594266 RepID=UPI00117A8BED|nr:hypothetical protein [Fulvivirga sp. M361]TRX62540.1 hypothetical protein FNH22_00140 [Fulvivirga sp. M361]
MEQSISILIDALGVYMFIGLLFAFWFVTVGVKKLDVGAQGTPWHFKLILVPGSILLWPVLTWKLMAKNHE